jgi:thimet oligopeptidase
LLDVDVEYANASYPITLPFYVATDKSLREASVEADKKLSAFSVEMSMKKDVFENVVFFKEKFGLENLTPELRRYVEKKIIDGKRDGKIIMLQT